ncbi:DUF1294 domain-containing protein [Acuticoccus sp.]|uniref:DUF1294 domain-containing protein n=1 Tax=Acuticoccus sp. TaxID=1904378 RepID=UPI003B5169B9
MIGAALAWLVAVNTVGLIVFWLDKRAAIAGRRRVPERVLIALAALGATPAILVGASVIRHKTRKQTFRAVVLALSAIQVGVLAAWVTGLV